MRIINTSQFAAIAVCVSSILSIVPIASAALITVNKTDDHNDSVCDSVDCTLREAILKANATVEADEISLVAGPVYTLTIGGQDDSGLLGDLDIRSSDLIISGLGKTIDANGMQFAIEVDTFLEHITVELRNLTIRGGQSGVRARSTADLTPTNVTIEDMSAIGVTNDGTIELQGCTISNCNLGFAGNPFSTSTLRNSVIRDNVRTFPTGAHGAGIFVGTQATMNIFDSLIANNQAMRNGGGIFAMNTTLNVSRVTGPV